jgi:hypothetical protein
MVNLPAIYAPNPDDAPANTTAHKVRTLNRTYFSIMISGMWLPKLAFAPTDIVFIN